MRKATLTILAFAVSLTLAMSGVSFACDGSASKASAKAACTGEKATEAKMANSKADCSAQAKLACSGDKATMKSADADDMAEGETIVLSVSNMTCNGCVKAVTNALVTTDGVSNAVVSLDDGTAKVTYDKEKIKTDDLINAVVKAGFAAQVFNANATTEAKVDGKHCDYSKTKGSCTGAKKKDSSI
jgi:copper chaperone CopZ